MFVKPAMISLYGEPARPRIVRDPRTKAILSAEGANVPDNDTYWLRRINQGDVVLAEAPKPAEPAAHDQAQQLPAEHESETAA